MTEDQVPINRIARAIGPILERRRSVRVSDLIWDGISSMNYWPRLGTVTVIVGFSVLTIASIVSSSLRGN